MSMEYESESVLAVISHVTYTLLICVVLAGPAIFVNRIDDVFRLLGSTTNPMSGYLLPTVFVLSLVPPKQHTPLKIIALIMSVAVASVSGIAFYQQICDIFMR